MPKNLKKWTTVEIEWLDSCHFSGWTKEKDVEYALKDMQFRTCGYFLKQTDYSIVVVQSRKSAPDDNSSVDAFMEIPKVAITKIRILK